MSAPSGTAGSDRGVGGSAGGSAPNSGSAGAATASRGGDTGAGASGSASGETGASGRASAGRGGTASSGGNGNASGNGSSGSGSRAGSGNGGSSGGGGATTTAGRGGASGATGSAGSGGAPGGKCVNATRLWFEDFETGDYERWTSKTYNSAWGNDCQSNGFTTEHPVSGSRAHRSEISCAYTAEDNAHRGYGGLQFSGDSVVPGYTNTGEGIDAPFGIVNTFHVWLDTSTVFENGTWFSFWTVNSSCDWSEPVLTLGLEDSSRRLAAAHYQAGAGGERVFLPGATAFPLGKWVRLTIYVNYHDQVMHVWQDGKQASRVTFDRPSQTICQWHWGAYASGDNDDIVLFEDDNSIWKLRQAWTDFAVEPWFGGSISACAAP